MGAIPVAAAANPAHLSAQLQSLFPGGVIAAELQGNAPPELLTEPELQSIRHCADKRIQDFAAGRACARLALHELGITGFSLLSAQDRQPIWPPGVVGSITHTEGYRAAVVARRADVSAIGIDCESIEAVTEEIWARICTAAELHRLRELPPAERKRYAALCFAAKEAFYKCQYPVTGRWVGFEDVALEPLAWPAAEGGFRLRPQSSVELRPLDLTRLRMRFQFRDRWVIAGIAAPVSD